VAGEGGPHSSGPKGAGRSQIAPIAKAGSW
jgi:hypothetical protein